MLQNCMDKCKVVHNIIINIWQQCTGLMNMSKHHTEGHTQFSSDTITTVPSW